MAFRLFSTLSLSASTVNTLSFLYAYTQALRCGCVFFLCVFRSFFGLFMFLFRSEQSKTEQNSSTRRIVIRRRLVRWIRIYLKRITYTRSLVCNIKLFSKCFIFCCLLLHGVYLYSIRNAYYLYFSIYGCWAFIHTNKFSLCTLDNFIIDK